MNIARGLSLPPRQGKKVASIAIPVGLEFVLILGLGLVNQIVVGGLGDTAVAAVGFANALNLIPMFALNAIGLAAGVVVARAYGGGHRHLVNTSTSSAIVLAVSLALIISIPFVLFPDSILRFAGASETVTAAGSLYLALILVSLPAVTVGQVLGGVLRSVDHPRSPMVATIISVVVNTPLAIIFVYGWGPIPAFGVVGAGIATLVSHIVKAVILLFQTYWLFDIADWRLPSSAKNWMRILKPILTLALPLALTSLAWTSGNFFYNVVVQQLGDGPLAAVQVVSAVAPVFIVGSLGLSSAITVLAGQAVGQEDPHLVTQWTSYIFRIGVGTSLIFGTLFALSSLALPALYPELSPEVVQSAQIGVLISAAMQPVIVRMLLHAAVLPSGNDTTGIIIGDIAGPFLFGLPLTIVLGFFTPLGVIGAFVGRAAEDAVKLAVFSFRSRLISWDRVVSKHLDSVALIGDPRTGPIVIGEDPGIELDFAEDSTKN